MLRRLFSSDLLGPAFISAICLALASPIAGSAETIAADPKLHATISSETQLHSVVLVLRTDATREKQLKTFLSAQQDAHSPDYHHWLTPAGFGERFGATDADISRVTGWLQNKGFEVTAVSKGRLAIEFSGTAQQVSDAFHTQIRPTTRHGVEGWANATEPQIPAEIAPSVKGILSLTNIPRRPQSAVLGSIRRARDTGELTPNFTYPIGKNNIYAVGPADFAAIYNVQPLWTSGTDGAGQSIAIVAQTNIKLDDVRTFRTMFGLNANDPEIILNGPDPGLIADEVEANLDVQWSGAVAPNAKIKLVVSQSTEATSGVDLSALYIVDNNIAPVMSYSYGACEADMGTAANAFYNALWQQAAAEGITVIVSSGDSGSGG